MATPGEMDVLKVAEVARALRIGIGSAYELCREPGFPAVRVRGQIRVPRDQFQRWIAERAGGVGQDKAA